MDQDKEIQLINERLNLIEKQLSKKTKSSTTLNFLIGFIVVIVLLMIAIGVVQFVRGGQ